MYIHVYIHVKVYTAAALRQGPPADQAVERHAASADTRDPRARNLRVWISARFPRDLGIPPLSQSPDSRFLVCGSAVRSFLKQHFF